MQTRICLYPYDLFFFFFCCYLFCCALVKKYCCCCLNSCFHIYIFAFRRYPKYSQFLEPPTNTPPIAFPQYHCCCCYPSEPRMRNVCVFHCAFRPYCVVLLWFSLGDCDVMLLLLLIWLQLLLFNLLSLNQPPTQGRSIVTENTRVKKRNIPTNSKTTGEYLRINRPKARSR